MHVEVLAQHRHTTRSAQLSGSLFLLALLATCFTVEAPAQSFKKLREYVKDVMNVMPVWEDNERVATAVQSTLIHLYGADFQTWTVAITPLNGQEGFQWAVQSDQLPITLLPGPANGVLQSVCDGIPNEPEATDCARSGGSITVLHPESKRMAVVMFSPFSEPPLDRETAQPFSDAISRATQICHAFFPDLTRTMRCLDTHLKVDREGGRPRALAVLPLSGFGRLPETGLARGSGHVFNNLVEWDDVSYAVMVLGPTPAA